jgi:hypothetical protein
MTTTIPHRTSRAKVRNIRGRKVRYLTPRKEVEAPITGNARIIEVDGATVGWVVCRGKAYGDPSLNSNYDFAKADGSGRMALEGFDRDAAVGRWLDVTSVY